uniref:Uncharacterized protein n=1 Tax=Arundo donax TaxID=35708 RepID=A0A0A9FT06_ARUDO
MGLRLMPRR